MIPLLQEYFYDDWYKLCLVLGCPIDRTTGQPLGGNPKPIVRCEMLSARDLLGVSDTEVEDRPSFFIDPAFHVAEGDALKAYLNGVVTAEKALA